MRQIVRDAVALGYTGYSDVDALLRMMKRKVVDIGRI